MKIKEIPISERPREKLIKKVLAVFLVVNS